MHRFSYGYTITRRQRQAVIARVGIGLVVLATVFGGLLGLVLGLLTGVAVGPLAALLAVLFGLTLAAVVVTRLSALERRAAWLDGSVLTVRDPDARSVDLAAAEQVRFLPTQTQWRETPAGMVGPDADFVPAIEVTADGETLRLLLSDADRTPLPKADLNALVGALSVVPAPGAVQAVAHLERLAAIVR